MDIKCSKTYIRRHNETNYWYGLIELGALSVEMKNSRTRKKRLEIFWRNVVFEQNLIIISILKILSLHGICIISCNDNIHVYGFTSNNS